MYKITFTARAETREKLQRAQDLLRHQVPNGDPAEIFDRALSALLDVLARKKVGASARPRPGGETGRGSRHVSAEVRRAVWRRDAGCCAFVAKSGRRCAERGFLEFHHEVPFAVGGQAMLRNVSLRCRAHSGYEAWIDSVRETGKKTHGIASASLTLAEVLLPGDETACGPGAVQPPFCSGSILLVAPPRNAC
jgi:hypothetical protein